MRLALRPVNLWRSARGLVAAESSPIRRDPRKDQLLQENGYLVLRFLGQDVGKELDLVLDTILRALSARRPSLARNQAITLSLANRP